jgi:hypothetical protein
MHDHEADLNAKALPKPIALTPEQVQQVAAGSAATLLQSEGPPVTNGPPPHERQ